MPFSRKGIFFVILLISSVNAQAQFFDSIGSSLSYRPALDFKLDSRNSFIAARLARIWGVKVGLDFNHTVKLGLGYNWLSNDINREFSIVNSRGEPETASAQFHFRYISAYGEYVFFRKHPWEVSVLVLVGYGRSHLSYFDQYWVHTETPSKGIILYEPYMTAEYRLFTYFGVGAGIGYRLAYSSDRFSRRQLNSPIYVLKVKAYLSDLYRDFVQK